MQTQTCFKSLVDEVTTVSDIEDLVGHALHYQNIFERRTSPWEMDLWEDGELQRFQVDLKKVDRLYHVHCYDDHISGSDYELMVRIAYKGRPIFVEMTAGCDFTGFDCEGGGTIYITFNANLFVKTIGTRYNEDLLLGSLQEDGYRIQPKSEFDLSPVSSWHNPPMLKFLCHLTVRDHKDHLKHYPELLPRILTESLNDFIIIKEAKEDYDNWD